MRELVGRVRDLIRVEPESRLSVVYVVVVGLFAVVVEVLPLPRLVQDLDYSLIGLSVAGAILVGLRRYQPRMKTAWYLMAAGQLLWVVADAIFNYEQDVLGIDTFPTIADLFYLGGYVVFALALGRLVRDRTRRSTLDMGPFLDTATVTAGLGLLSWVLLARPTIDDLSNSPLAATVAAAYPAMDILLVGVLVRLLSTSGGRSPAFRLLLAALALLITADTMSAAFGLFTANTVSAVEYLWLLSYAAWGGAALHPSMARLSESGASAESSFQGLRLVAVVVATMVAPAILAVQKVSGASLDVWAVVVGSVVMFLLVVIRMNLSLQQIVSAHQALEDLQHELAIQATHDPMTGLFNRGQTMRLLAGALGRSRRRGNTVGLLFIDLDGFKLVNDTHGHRAGDEVLKQTAKRMQEEIREGDFVGRLGGDEFVVGIEDVTDERAAIALAQRLIFAVSGPIDLGEGVVAHVGASIGVALGRGGETNAEGLLNEADLAVYEAKAAGRGRYQLFDGSARAALRKRNELERAIAHAIATDELVLHYQPIVDTVTGEVACYEALVRWDRPGVGLVPPGEFLPTAETSDLICNLDVWVLDAALAQLEIWNRERGDRTLQVSVNLSGRHVVQRRVLNDVAQALAFVEVDPGQLVLEVTETVITDGSLATPHLEALRETGVVISLDDFGTGYTSNGQLARLPVDILKIDRQFLDIDVEQTRSLLELTVKVGHAFGVRVVAEGIEYQEQLDIVRELGCEYVQGFFIARPAPPYELPGSEHPVAV